MIDAHYVQLMDISVAMNKTLSLKSIYFDGTVKLLIAKLLTVKI